ncbi:Predicted Zn-dependent protease or its inactivated homolog [Thermomonospora echinospora]|uniref:Predicted Zn-dependent protease or its inactivated homolog n=1 Tax=Thermomonospora echinospora TaxID=1992 RepID=A0A1H6C1Q0_9ACTN|nr:metallopeptidase TldD-related protein [Thermomonospora echinospora]SEG66286.1 Predicted Zn-dependent protease or its inactivated homolog [Thermomonospora echinospora]
MTPQESVERALELSRADECVVIADESSTANLRWAGNTLTTNGVTRSRRLTVIAMRRAGDGVATGVVSRTAVGADEIEDVVREAERVAADSGPAEDAAPLASGGPAAGGAWDEPPTETEIGVFATVAPALGEAFAAAQAAGHRLYGFANHQLTSTFLGTSGGLRLRHDQPTGLVELNAKLAGAAGGGSAWTGMSTRDFTDVDVPALADELARRLEWSRRRVELPAGRYETLLPPSAVADLMIYLYWTAGARDAHDGRTVFSAPGGRTRVGEKLADLPVTLSSDPHAAGLQCAPFVIARASGRDSSVFDNGLAVPATNWIADGTLNALTQTRHSAALTGLPSTPRADNLIMRGPDGAGASLEDMVARTERGLLLTCLWYIREVDPQRLLLTGLTRDGVYLVEGGEVVGEVNNFRFNESPVDLLSRLTEVGATGRTLPREWSDYFTRTAMPPVRVADFNMSTVSQAS